MKQKIKLLSIALLTLFFTQACEKTTEPDTTPLQVSISAPVNNETVKDTVSIIATVADNDGVSKVDFLIDGVSIGTVTKSPFQIEWDTKQSSNGVHNLQCKAVDNSGNETLSEIVKVTVANYLFKATFKNNWLPSDAGEAVIFISDMDGNLLAERTWTGNDSFELFADNGIKDDITEISVTTVVKYGSQTAFITTNMNVPVGSSWTWEGRTSQADYDNPYNVEFNFQNMPEHQGFVLSSKWNSHISNSDTLSSSFSYNFYESPMDIYLKLNTVNNGVKYAWINNVVPGSRQDDLSNMLNASKHTINLQGSSYGYHKNLYGIPNPGRRYEGIYRLDYGRDNENTVNSIDVYFPESSFSDYRTSIYFYDDYNSRDYWYQSTYGAIPDNFTKISADFNFISGTYDNFEISTSGDEFLEIRTFWHDENYYNHWEVYCDKSTVKYKLPNLPNSAIQLFSSLDRESFRLSSTDLIDHSELNSYQEILNILFNSNEYFYDVVNDIRSRTKYYDNGGYAKQNENRLEFEELYENTYLIR